MGSQAILLLHKQFLLDHAVTHMNISALEALVQDSFKQGLFESTIAAYSSAKYGLIIFCNEFNIFPLLLKEKNLCLFGIFWLSKAFNTVQNSFILQPYVACKSCWPSFFLEEFQPRLQYMIKEAKRWAPCRICLPITMDIMHRLLAVWSIKLVGNFSWVLQHCLTDE